MIYEETEKEEGKEMSRSKLSPALKSLINAPFARPDVLPATKRIRDVYSQIQTEARLKNVEDRPWIALSVCTPPPLSSTGGEREEKTNRWEDSSDNDDELTRIPRNSIPDVNFEDSE